VDAADFVVRLIDKATAPAKRISAAFAGIEKSLKPVTHSKAFKAIDKAGTKLWDFGKDAVLVGGVVGVGLAGAFTKAAFDAAMFTENTKLAFSQLTHSAAGGEQAFATVRGLVSGLGLDLHDTTDGMRKLLAAQFSLGQSTELLKMGADLSVIGIHGEEVARVLTAISQIKAKGKLQAEEMMQLAEAGISLTLVNGALQKSLGKTAAEVDKMKQAGQITGEIGIAAIQSAVKEKLGIENFGDARKKFVNENLSGMIESLKSAGQLLFLKLGDSVLGKKS
jgi:tape measure domain-containing protein